jgi:hypothetical protein
MCKHCGHIEEMFYGPTEQQPRVIECAHCEDNSSELLPSAVGGYNIKGNNSASQRPKQAGSFKKKV